MGELFRIFAPVYTTWVVDDEYGYDDDDDDDDDDDVVVHSNLDDKCRKDDYYS